MFVVSSPVSGNEAPAGKTGRARDLVRACLRFCVCLLPNRAPIGARRQGQTQALTHSWLMIDLDGCVLSTARERRVHTPEREAGSTFVFGRAEMETRPTCTLKGSCVACEAKPGYCVSRTKPTALLLLLCLPGTEGVRWSAAVGLSYAISAHFTPPLLPPRT